jgi:protein-disulfide isomerase
MKRRQILIGGLALAGLTTLERLGLLWPRQALAAEEIFEDDRILGNPEAPITIIEYSSLTCPHCASFHRNTLPQLRDSWLKDGRARLVFRDYPLDRVALTAAVLAHCLEGDKRYFGFIDVLFQQQKSWARSSDPVSALRKLSRLAGMDSETFDQCLADQAKIDRILEKVQDAQNKYEIQSTPTFIVNGEKFPGDRSFEDFEKILGDASS